MADAGRRSCELLCAAVWPRRWPRPNARAVALAIRARVWRLCATCVLLGISIGFQSTFPPSHVLPLPLVLILVSLPGPPLQVRIMMEVRDDLIRRYL